jgi:hypothetical protein
MLWLSSCLTCLRINFQNFSVCIALGFSCSHHLPAYGTCRHPSNSCPTNQQTHNREIFLTGIMPLCTAPHHTGTTSSSSPSNARLK